MNRRRVLVAGVGIASVLGLGLASVWDDLVERRVSVVVPGRIVRGAWQRPGPLRRLLAREKIRTIVTLTAINRDDPKYVAQERVVRELGIDWIIVPMRGSRATVAQMAEAADFLADPRRWPVYFHCVGGHHRSNLTHAAYRIRHARWTADRAWHEVASLPWTRPTADHDDRRLIEAFARAENARALSRKDSNHATAPALEMGHPDNTRGSGAGWLLPGGTALGGELRDRHSRSHLPVRPDERGHAWANGSYTSHQVGVEPAG